MSWINFLDIVYPTGSLYMNISDTSPASIIGGAWSKIENAAIAAIGTNYTAGDTGSLKISINQMPEHNHRVSGKTAWIGRWDHPSNENYIKGTSIVWNGTVANDWVPTYSSKYNGHNIQESVGEGQITFQRAMECMSGKEPLREVA